jgi:chaperone required for assembly of F1-ATPase
MSSEQQTSAANNFRRLANVRLSNKVGWNLAAIQESAEFGRASLGKAMAIAERKLDAELVIHLARLQADLARIERKASDALRGEFRDD